MSPENAPGVRLDVDEPASRSPSVLLPAISCGTGVLALAVWPLVGLPAPLVGVIAFSLGVVALRRDPHAAGSGYRWLARLGVGIGVVKLTLWVGFLLVVGVTAFSQMGV